MVADVGVGVQSDRRIVTSEPGTDAHRFVTSLSPMLPCPPPVERLRGGRRRGYGAGMVLSDGVSLLTITIIPTPYPGTETDDDALILEIDEPAGLDEDRLRDDLIAMTGLTDGFILEERRTQTEWGASGLGYDITLTVAQMAWAGIVGTAAWELLRTTARQLTTRAPDSGPIDDEGAQGRARWRVTMRYPDVAAEDLQAVKTTTTTGTDGYGYTVRLRAASGEEYIVTCTANGDTSMTRIERTTD